MAKHKKNVFCRADIHDFDDNKCIECGEWRDVLFADESWYRGQFITMDKPKKSHKKTN